jgi:hypothetical protein
MISKSEEPWRKYLTPEEATEIETLKNPSRARTNIIALCYERRRAEGKISRCGSNKLKFEKEVVAIKEIMPELEKEVKGFDQDLLEINKPIRDITKDKNDWQRYLTAQEKEIMEIIGMDHPESFHIREKCYSRKYYHADEERRKELIRKSRIWYHQDKQKKDQKEEEEKEYPLELLKNKDEK